jgi:hypothetical protein
VHHIAASLHGLIFAPRRSGVSRAAGWVAHISAPAGCFSISAESALRAV